MTQSQILKWLDPAHQNLPVLKCAPRSNAPYHYIPVREGSEKEWARVFPFLKKLKLSGKKGELVETVQNNRVYRFEGVGKAEKFTARAVRRYYGRVYLNALGAKPGEVALYAAPEHVELAAMAVHVAALDPKMFKPHFKPAKLPAVVFVGKADKKEAEAALKKGALTAEAKNLMRVLGALPPNVLHPQSFAAVIEALAKQWGYRCKRVAAKEIEQKYQLLNAVSRGAAHHSELLVISVDPPRGASKKAVALIGKGICFDSGGMNSKGNQMKSMKEDMAGAAGVLGVLLQLKKGRMAVKETTHFVMPLAENMIGPLSTRSDDVWTAGDGQTVEVINTDAEGRLIVGDAICYVKNHFKNVDRFITVATLTGSCVLALGELYTGLICNDESMAEKAKTLGRECGDLVHHAPWDTEFDDYHSPVADLTNYGDNPRDAGWIKGGMYLYRFLPKPKDGQTEPVLCHFDIAGSIDMYEKGRAWRRKGFSSGVLVPVLTGLVAV